LVKHFKEGNGHRRSAALWSTDNCCNWEQQAKSQRAHQTRRKDNSQRNYRAAWSGAPCGPGDDGDFGISESLFPLGSPFAYGYRESQNSWVLLSHPPYSPNLASLRLPLVRVLENHITYYHYETDEAVQEAVRSWLWGAGTGFYRRDISKILQRWQKCIDQDGNFVER
jgi:hypothetical protein